MNNCKKIILILVSCILIFSFSACKNENRTIHENLEENLEKENEIIEDVVENNLEDVVVNNLEDVVVNNLEKEKISDNEDLEINNNNNNQNIKTHLNELNEKEEISEDEMKKYKIINDKDTLDKSLLFEGNLTRLIEVMEKAKNGEKITFGVLGGSITEGAAASSKNLSYSYLVYSWWKDMFPKSEIKYVNAGIGATGSVIGAHRIEKDLLVESPDFVILEYAVNDSDSELLSKEAYEGIIRRILLEENNPALMLLFMMTDTGYNVQNTQIELGLHYKLPMVSYKDAIYPKLQENTLKWAEISPDNIHPNDKGHQMAADMIIYSLNNAYKKIDNYNKEITNLPKPKTKNRLENANILNNKTLNVISKGVFAEKRDTYIHFKDGFVSTKKGDPLIFESTSNIISLLYLKKVNNGGSVDILVDNKRVKTIDSDFTGGFGDYPAYEILIYEDDHEKRKIEIKFSNENDDGDEFCILGILES